MFALHLTDWEKDYKKKVTTAEEAIQVVKAGDNVIFAYGTERWLQG